MNFGVFATTVFSLAVLNGAYAENNKDRVFVEARWYTEAYVKQSLANINPRLLSAAFPPMANYVFAADTPGLRPEGENLLKKEVWSIEGGFVRWPPKKDGKTLKTQWDDMCVTLSARGLKGLYYEARLRSRLTTPKDLVISRIETGELVSAPSSLDASRGRDRGYEVIKGRRQKLSATPDLSGTVLPLCPIPNSALKNAPPFKSAMPKASACAGLPA